MSGSQTGGSKGSARHKKASKRGLSLGSLVPGADAIIGATRRRVKFRKLSLRSRLLILAPFAVASVLVTAMTGVFIYYTITFPDPLTLRTRERAPIIRILARDGSVIAERGAAHDYMPLDLLPPMVTNAVVATEDRRFWDHWGLDPVGMGRAAFANLRAGRFAQGGSTLTQQLAKNLFLTPERTLGRKFEEFVLAMWLELRLTKSDILELYLNRVYFGGGAYGIEAAAKRYFDKSARELSLAEAAVIAGLLKAPSRYAPSANPKLAIARSHVVLTSMRETGLITADQDRKARAQRLAFFEPRHSPEKNAADYAIDFALERLPPLLGSGHSEVVVDTTLDNVLQRRAAEIVNKELILQGAALDASQAAVVILDTDGGIRALVGGRNYAESQFNRAVKARRQPGSAFKPFIYLAALESGFTPDSIAYDLPLTVQGWSPRNDNGRYAGPIPLRQALSQSVNTVAVRLMLDAGPAKVAAMARRLGITSDLREDPSLALGTSEVSLLELTGAYGAFATGGRGVEPHIIRRVRMGSGRILYARPAPQADQLASPAAIGAMNDMLAETLRSGTGRRAALVGHMAAGKTGTSQEFRDAWFVGYTAHLVGGVWLGNDQGRTMNHVTGGLLPAQIWHQIMTIAHEGKAPLALPGIELVEPPPPPGFNDEMAQVPYAPSVRQELLPWNIKKVPVRQAQPRKSPAATPRAVAKVTPLYPSDRIDEDFIARALREDAQAGSGKVAAEAAAPTGRIVVRPPRGMMGLGAEAN
jgi:penicillin-binding protein 1A